MKNLLLLLALLAVSPAFAQQDVSLVIVNKSEESYILDIDLAAADTVENGPRWVTFAFTGTNREHSLLVKSLVIYPLKLTLWVNNEKSLKYDSYPSPARASVDTLFVFAGGKIEPSLTRIMSAIDQVETDLANRSDAEYTVSKTVPANMVVEAPAPPPVNLPVDKTSPAPVGKAKKGAKKNIWGDINAWNKLSEAQQDTALLLAGKCALVVRNQTPDIFKFRVGHLWWETQSGLLPEYKAVMFIDTDEHHELHRYIWRKGVLRGSEREDVYSFYIPRGIARDTLTFGGTQSGRVVNQCGVAIRVSTPVMNQAMEISTNGYRDDILSMTGQQIFIVEFGPDFKRYHQIPFRIDDKPADNIVIGREGQRRVDFLAIITPEDLRTARYR